MLSWVLCSFTSQSLVSCFCQSKKKKERPNEGMQLGHTAGWLLVAYRWLGHLYNNVHLSWEHRLWHENPALLIRVFKQSATRIPEVFTFSSSIHRRNVAVEMVSNYLDKYNWSECCIFTTLFMGKVPISLKLIWKSLSTKLLSEKSFAITCEN